MLQSCYTTYACASSAPHHRRGTYLLRGLIICGRGTNNKGVLGQQIEGGPRTKHGGNDPQDCSGVLSYVRVEFAGYPFQKDKEINYLYAGSQYVPTAGSPALTRAAFTDPLLQTWFDKVPYVGAFSTTDNWLRG